MFGGKGKYGNLEEFLADGALVGFLAALAAGFFAFFSTVFLGVEAFFSGFLPVDAFFGVAFFSSFLGLGLLVLGLAAAGFFASPVFFGVPVEAFLAAGFFGLARRRRRLRRAFWPWAWALVSPRVTSWRP